jgi:hypothetical protein
MSFVQCINNNSAIHIKHDKEILSDGQELIGKGSNWIMRKTGLVGILMSKIFTYNLQSNIMWTTPKPIWYSNTTDWYWCHPGWQLTGCYSNLEINGYTSCR